MITPIRKNLPLVLAFAALTLNTLVIPMAGAAVWLTNSPMYTPRDSHTATVLTNGKVLIVGGRNNGVSPVLTNAELFDPVTQLFSNTAALAVARESHTATLLPNGKVLVAGGVAAGGVITNSAELYDAATGTWTPTGLMKTRRLGHTATLLPDGKVLVAAGLAAIGGLIILTNSAELYDPASGTWTFTNAMSVKRYNHTATLLADGRVLIAGGDNGVNSLASVELFNPTNGTWTPSIMPMSSPRFSHTATLLPDGRVLLAGGFGASGITNTSELLNPIDGSWSTPLNTMATARRMHTATLLPNGKVLVAGGGNAGSGAITNVEVYNPATATWTAIDALNTGRSRHTATLLPTKLLVAGGTASNGSSLSSTELYDFAFTDIDAGLPPLYRGALAWGDYDNDGRLDLLTTGIVDPFVGQAEIYLHQNNGSNFTANNPALPGVTGDSRNGALAWGDYDNDGWLDVVLAGVSSASVFYPFTRIMRGSGTSFTDIHAGLPGVVSCSVAWGDSNNDGRADMLLSGYPHRCEIWGNSSSVFTNANAGMSDIADGAARWGDYDNDGRLDVLAAGGGNAHLWHNTGGVFTDSGLALPPVTDVALAWADYDNDGWLDFLLTGFDGTNAHSQLWHNTGGGFTRVSVPGLPGVFYGAVAWGDYDNDGRADFLLTGATGTNSANAPIGYISQVWRNTGSGFVNSGVTLPGVFRSSVAWGDYNNDGRLDIALMGTTATAANGDPTAWVTAIWRNYSAVTNTPPTAPGGLATSMTNNVVTLSWNAASDAQTPSGGLTYNLRVGTTPGGSDVVGPMAASNGLRRVPEMGNRQHARIWSSSALPVNVPLYWSVQAVDNAFAGSLFSTEASFKLFQSPPILTASTTMNLAPGDFNGDGLVSQSELDTVLTNYFPNSPFLQMTNVAGLGGTNVTFALTNNLAGSFSVEYTTNLANWQFLGPATPRYEFTDTNAPSIPQRYYRLRWP